MNIMFINATRGWGGVKTWMVQLAEFLSHRGHQITVVCQKHDELVDKCQQYQIACYPLHFGMDFSPRSIAWFLKLFQQEHTEVVITNISKGFRTGGVAAKLKGVAHINRLGARGDLKDTLKARLLYTLLVDRVFVSSQYLFNHFAQQDFMRPKLRWFHNALTPPPLNICRNTPLKFAVVAKLSQYKQVDKVLYAFSRLTDLAWELHIGGFGPELDTLQQLSEQLGLQQAVHFAGKVESYAFLQDKDVGILYSSEEAFGYSVIEYMACSCAVIASKTGGIPEIITSDVDGVLVNPHDLNSLEKAIRRLIDVHGLRERFIRNGYATVQQHFTQEAIFPLVEEEIRHTIAHVRR